MKKNISILLVSMLMVGLMAPAANALETTTAAVMSTAEVTATQVEVVESEAELDSDYMDTPRAFLLRVIWGDLDRSVEPGVDPTTWDGTLECNNCNFGLRTEYLMERIQDKLVHDGNFSTVTFESEIYSHFDGFYVKVNPKLFPEEDGISVTFNSEYFAGGTYTFDELREGVTADARDGYKVHLKAMHPLDFWKKLTTTRVVEVRWGNLNGEWDPEAPDANYEGMLAGNGVKVERAAQVLFEANDEITSDADDPYVSWDSHIQGHWDGLLVALRPLEDLDNKDYESDDLEAVTIDATAEKSITLTLGDFEKTFTSPDEFGRFELGDGYYVEIITRLDFSRAIADAVQTAMFLHKVGIMIRLHALDALISELEKNGVDVSEYYELREAIADYNFSGEGEEDMGIYDLIDEMMNAIEESGMTEEELDDILDDFRGDLAEVKDDSRLKKFVQGILAFKDVDDDQWFHKFVESVYKREIIGGYYDEEGNPLGEFRPTHNVSVCEMLKIALVSGEHDIPTSASAYDYMPTWCEPYYEAGLDAGLSLLDEENLDGTRDATRAEVVRILIEAVLGEEEVEGYDLSNLPSDVDESHPDAEYIAFAFDTGIVSGDGDTGNFRPDDSIIRAEVAKVVDNTLELLSS